MADYIFRSERLGFRKWFDQDLKPFASMNQNDDVMPYFPSKHSLSQSETSMIRFNKHIEEFGFGFFAIVEEITNSFIGFIGIQHVRFQSSFTPAVELGYRLDAKFWNRGYASEGSMACISWAWRQTDLEKIVSFTSVKNIPSISVMKKSGMDYVADFQHPSLPPEHALSEHVLYEIERPKV